MNTPIELLSDRLRVQLLPGLGAGVSSLEIRTAAGWRDAWRRAPEAPATFNELACYTLAPWCNRIDNALVDFDGRQLQLKPNWHDGTAIHGDVHHREWRLTDRSPVSARFEITVDMRERNWPWPFACATRYELGPDSLTVGMSVTNLGGSAMPVGMGLHSFWMKHLGDTAEQAIVRMPVSGRYPCERVMATGPAVEDELCARLAAGCTIDEPLDDVFKGFTYAEVAWPVSGVRARMDAHAALSHSVIFNEAGRDWFCLEPVSMVNNGISLRKLVPGTGVQVLGPRATYEWWARFSFSFEG